MSESESENKWAVVVVFSHWPLAQLYSFIEEELEADKEQIGVMRIDRVKGKESNRTIMLVDKAIFDVAEEKGYTKRQQELDFRMSKYEIRDFDLPRRGCSNNLYVPVPTKISGVDARSQLENKLEVLSEFGLLENVKPRLVLPLKSRETGGEHNGSAYITFPKSVPVETIALVRLLLHDTRFYYTESDFDLMKCFWAKIFDKAPVNHGGKRGKKTRVNKDKREERQKAPAPIKIMKTVPEFVPKSNSVDVMTADLPVDPSVNGEEKVDLSKFPPLR